MQHSKNPIKFILKTQTNSDEELIDKTKKTLAPHFPAFTTGSSDMGIQIATEESLLASAFFS